MCRKRFLNKVASSKLCLLAPFLWLVFPLVARLIAFDTHVSKACFEQGCFLAPFIWLVIPHVARLIASLWRCPLFLADTLVGIRGRLSHRGSKSDVGRPLRPHLAAVLGYPEFGSFLTLGAFLPRLLPCLSANCVRLLLPAEGHGICLHEVCTWGT